MNHYRVSIAFGLLGVLAWPAIASAGPASQATEQLTAKDLERGIRQGDVELVTRALKAGVDVNGSSRVGQAPPRVAVLGGRDEIVKLLIRSGADIDAVDALGQTVLQAVVWLGRARQIEMLLANGVELDLWSAAGLGRLDEVRKLVRSYAGRPGMIGPRGTSPLHWAARGGHVRTVQWLLERGLPVGAPAMKQRTPLHEAARNFRGKLGRRTGTLDQHTGIVVPRKAGTSRAPGGTNSTTVVE